MPLLDILAEIWQLVPYLILLVVAFIIIGLLAVIIFWRTNKVFIPKVMLMVLDILESPIKWFMRRFKIEETKFDFMIISIRNNLFRPAYSRVPYNKRAIFIPQCLRSPECPAKLSPEGIQCINCGRCGLGELKKFSEDLGCRFFIVPGSSFIKRMVKKYKPWAVLGVGCTMEIKEGLILMDVVGLPSQGVLLKRDGCVDTRVDIGRVMNAIALSEKETGVSSSIKTAISDMKTTIQNMWAEDECPKDIKQKSKRS